MTDLGLEPIAGTSANDKDRQILEQFQQIAFSEETGSFDNIVQNGQKDGGETVECSFQV
jgi:hypothetical protein